jgi:hypothetical protein
VVVFLFFALLPASFGNFFKNLFFLNPVGINHSVLLEIQSRYS